MVTTNERMDQIKDGLEKADAANWDSHYAGSGGITADYARVVHGDVLLALESLTVLREQIAEMECERDEWQEAEASVCPEDVGVVECVLALRRQITSLTAERDRAVDALRRNRQGYMNILEFRKLDSEKWGQRDGYGGRYGALTREEIETVVAEIDAALSAAPPQPKEK